LQKKGWLGVPKNEKWGKGQKRFIQNLFDSAQQEDTNFFKDKLQYLFYEALAKERNSEQSFYEKFKCRVPFLNGGLFEAEYQWETANISIPKNIFRNQEKNKAGDIGTGVLDVFDRYNFTIKEDEPLDKEVAVDPEMLGKVFENMLEITERKSKGAFYTPREIVHYMCQESLIHYLDNALDGKVKKQDIETYIRKGHNALENDQRVARKGEETATYKYILPKSIRKNADLIDQKLIDIKICDPAIGSGAFPVGLLHELVNAQLVIKPHFSDNYLNAKLKEFQFTKKEIPSESRYIYRLKRHIIQESIYGVDIDASAIDIARLRLWLSLVVDEDDFDPIETLPNLDYKIVYGNSLISRYHLDMPIDNVFKEFNKKVQSNDYNNKAIKNLVGTKEIDLAYYKKLTNDFLLESAHDKKVLFRELISEIKNAFTTTLGQDGLRKISMARGAIENLQQSDIFGKQAGTKTQISKAKKHFAALQKEKKETEDGALFKNAVEWRFEFPNLLNKEGDFVGFDVVIGNPPYGELIKEGKEYFKSNYKSTEGKYETYKYFIERGLQLYNNKGCEVYITPDTWISLGYFKKLRESIIKSSFVYLITETLYDVFKGATVDNNIFILSNNKGYSKTQLVSGNLKTVINIKLRHLENDYSLVLKPENSIVNKVDGFSNKINDYCEVWQGLIAYGSKDQPREWTSLEKESNEYKKLLYGGNIGLFSIKWKEEYLKYGDWLHRPRPVYIYEQPHILVQRIRNPRLKQRIKAAIDRNFHINGTGTSNILVKENSPLQLEEILCLINSELINYWFSYYFFDVNIKPEQLRQIPLPSVSTNSLNIIERYLEATVKEKTNNVLFSFFWSLCNAIVYELYFEQELKQANKQVLKHLTGLKTIDDTMSVEEKTAIIQEEFERLYHPEHPVRFAVETLDSIEEVRIIKEALR
jgi:23S rRNA G2445 N2-methylase RlmL